MFIPQGAVLKSIQGALLIIVPSLQPPHAAFMLIKRLIVILYSGYSLGRIERMNTAKTVAGILLLLTMFCWAARDAQCAPTDDGIKLKQHCKSVVGDYTVQISSKMIRVENRSLVIFAQAPNWDMTVLNVQKKLYYQSDYKSCLRMIAATKAPFNLVADMRAQKWRKSGSENIAGLSAEKWLGSAPKTDHPSKNSNAYWTLPGNEFAPQCAEIVATC